jgi:hypothetical protein
VSEPAVQPDTLAGDELDRRSARKDGREIVALRCVEANGGFAIECDVYPANGLRVEPLRPGPYRFATRADADSFIAEAVRALEYLGCDVSLP